MTKELNSMHPLGGDFLQADEGFRKLLKDLAPASGWGRLEDVLSGFSAKVSGRWNALAEEAANDYQGPKLESFDRVGNPIDRVWLPPPVRQIRREVVEAGIFENDSQLEQFAKVALLSHLGEASVTCPLSCTEGLIRSIEAVGSEFLKKNYLPKIKSAETPLAGAQFVTEMDMGSDVGALTTKAVAVGEGKWKLTGEKWFCSAIDEFFLVAARPEGAPKGTEGVAIFLVPRTIDGKLNDLRIKRLKDKLGTRELPTAEIELNGALAFNIGPVEQGFKSLMNYVLNTSRLMNAASGCGLMARAYLEGENYAKQRSVFGKKMIEYPLVRESLAKIRSILTARRSLFFHAVAELDRNPQKDSAAPEAFWQRFLINLCKYRTAIGATECTHEAILLLGGNGTIETFSILPRLYRDSMIIETWEGTHNTLSLQICRDATRFPFQKFLEERIAKKSQDLRAADLNGTARWIEVEWRETLPAFQFLTDAAWVAHNARRLVDHLGVLLEVAYFPKDDPLLLDTYQAEASSSLREFVSIS